MLLGKVILFSSIILLYVKAYYVNKIENIRNPNRSVWNKFDGLYFVASIFVPILRKSTNKKEDILIQKANLAILFFWVLFILGMIIILVSPLL